ncbi:hypothetical protein CKAH01_13112 [Colletotrichum kahawae]|uniref:Uncharacterized protein n=1 Tax=Colletotrichum kahawae TaxID=34407 RepID=A0AAD9YP50_COLKA|nr:hypothetical protein CKAH01_13112 [Colletotrichum kahawae]
MAESSRAGCRMCGFIRAALLERGVSYEGDVFVNGGYLWGGKGDAYDDSNVQDIGLGHWTCEAYKSPRGTRENKVAILNFDIETNDDDLLQWLRLDSKCAPEPLDPENIQWLKSELRSCEDECEHVKPASPFLPTRLIDVGRSEMDVPRLIITEDMDNLRTTDDVNMQDVYWGWTYVNDVKTRAWTYREDIFPGISGLAQGFAAITRDTYLAGLWKGDLHHQLVWEISHPPFGDLASLVDSLRHATPYIAPSWSWASQTAYHENLPHRQFSTARVSEERSSAARKIGKQFFKTVSMPSHVRPEFTLIDYRMDLQHSNLFGPLTGALLRFKGKMCSFPSDVTRGPPKPAGDCRPSYDSTWFSNGYESIDKCKYCADPFHKRTGWGLVVHPAEEHGSYHTKSAFRDNRPHVPMFGARQRPVAGGDSSTDKHVIPALRPRTLRFKRQKN